MWYAFVPGDGRLQRYFIGLTDNLFRFRSYCEMMNKFDVENIMPITEYPGYESCKEAVIHVLNMFPNYGDYDESGIEYLVDESTLMLVKGNIEENYIVVSETAYDYFVEIAMNPEEVKKMMNRLYGICHSYSLGVLSYLYYDSLDGKVVKRVIEIICRLWNEYGAVYKKHGPFKMLSRNHKEGCNKSYIWSLFDQSVYLKLWMEMEIKSSQYGLPLSCLGDSGREVWDDRGI